MAPFLYKFLRGAVLGLLFLLAGTANLVTLSCDADDDEDTPPISIELNILTPSKKIVQVSTPRSNSQAFHLGDEKPVTARAASAVFESPTLLEQKSPQLQVPLRT